MAQDVISLDQMMALQGGSPSGSSLPAPMRNNNPGAMMPGGRLAKYSSMEEGFQAMENNLSSYGKKGIDTIEGVISRWAPPVENDTKSYIKDVANRLGIPPHAKIDLQDPEVRKTLASAIAHHENGREVPRKPSAEPYQPNTLSLADMQKLHGGEKEASSAPLPQPTSIASVALATAQEGAALGDMLLNTPTAMFALGGNALRRAEGVAKGEDRAASAKAGKEIQDKIQATQPDLLKKFVGLFSQPGQPVGPAQSEKAMNYLMILSDKGAKELEEKTHGVILADDVNFLRDTVMTSLGAKGLAYPMGKLGESLGKAKPESVKAAVEAPTPPEVASVPGPRARADIDKITGITDVAQRTKAKGAMRNDARAAFSDDAQYGEYLSNRANAETRQAGRAAKEVAPDRQAKLQQDLTFLQEDLAKSEAELAGMEHKPEQLASRAQQDAEWKVNNYKKQIENTKELITSPIPDRFINKQSGKIDSRLLVGMAALGVGAATGVALDPENPISGALLGAIGGAAIASGTASRAVKGMREAFKTDTRFRINDLTEAREHGLKANERAVYQAQNSQLTLVPKEEGRVRVNTAIDEGKVDSLTGKELVAAKEMQKFYSDAATLLQDEKMMKAAREDYTTHLWQPRDKAKVEALVAKKYGSGMSPKTRFTKERTYLTMVEGKAAGLVPLTEDSAKIMGIYGNSVGRAIANKRFLDSLYKVKAPGNMPLIASVKTAPPNYVTINHPQLQGVRIHPDIAPSLKFMFESSEPGAAMAAMEAVNTALKRNVVSFSLFHAKALADAALGAVKSPLSVTKMLAQASLPKVFGENRYLKMLKEGGAGDLVDNAYKDGLVFSMERADPAVEDVGGGFYKGMTGIQNMLDATVPGTGAVVKGYMGINHAVDNFMWGRLHAGMKLEVYASKVEALMENNAKAGHPISRAEAGKAAASYTNDVFGGLNWQRIAEGARTRFGRDLALDVLSPKGRRATQLALFAPDWTLSTTRAFTQGITHKGSGPKGLIAAKTLADLHRQQLVRSAFYYAVIGDGINYANTGHHLWENKDWTRVELGDGRTMMLSKHFVEPFHWVMHPGQQAINKLGMLPKEGLDQALGVDYLSAGGRMPKMDASAAGRLKHAGKLAAPIGIQQFQQGGPAAGVSGMLGVPIYGMTEEQKRAKRMEQAMIRFRKHQEELGK